MKRMLYLRVALSKSRPTTNSAGNTKWNVQNLMANLPSHQRWIDLPANLKASDCYSLVVGSSEERPACLRRLPAVRCCANPKKVEDAAISITTTYNSTIVVCNILRFLYVRRVRPTINAVCVDTCETSRTHLDFQLQTQKPSG
jgi:hypothetical protein